ncbi:hypothetical protein MBT84_45080 [Streptomyces sp. MBT84]|nr:hypothetical protein [Streptomyces sp. MBT84]
MEPVGVGTAARQRGGMRSVGRSAASRTSGDVVHSARSWRLEHSIARRSASDRIRCACDHALDQGCWALWPDRLDARPPRADHRSSLRCRARRLFRRPSYECRRGHLRAWRRRGQVPRVSRTRPQVRSAHRSRRRSAQNSLSGHGCRTRSRKRINGHAPGDESDRRTRRMARPDACFRARTRRLHTRAPLHPAAVGAARAPLTRSRAGVCPRAHDPPLHAPRSPIRGAKELCTHEPPPV